MRQIRSRTLVVEPSGAGVIRHADAGYDIAIETARKFKLDLPGITGQKNSNHSPGSHVMRSLAMLAPLLLASPLFAQTGPLEARLINSAKTSPFPKLKRHDNVAIVIELTVGTDGRASDARVLESSGKKLDDETVRKYFLKSRFVPALDEAGTPILSTVKAKYIRQTSRPDPASSGSSQMRVDNEVQRIERMKCKDFVWEYDFMREAAQKRRLSLGEELFQSSFAMFISREQVSDAQIAALSRSVVPAMDASAQACRNKPNEAFFSSVFSPTLKAAAGH